MTAALRRSVSSLSVPNYRRYFTGQVISVSGNWMQIVAEVWLILQLTGSGTAVGLVAALQFAPILLFGAFGGMLADRVPKRKLLQLTQAAMVVPALSLFALYATGAVEPWMVFVLVFLRGTINAIDNPTRQSFVIEMVGADRVVNAVSLNSVIVHASRIAGPGGRGRRDLGVGRRALFHPERRDVRGDDRRAAGDGPGASSRARPSCRARRARCAPRCATCARRPRCACRS